MTKGDVDFQLLFEASPEVLIVLLPDAPRYTAIAATRARLLATHNTAEQTVGRGLFELFPDNPDDPAATGSRNLRASLDRVLATRQADTMAVQKYDIRQPDGRFVVKYWSPKNIPVLADDGSVKYILHRVEDVTELVQASELGEKLQDRSRQMERDVITRSRELAVANNSLRDANERLGELDRAKTAFFSNVSHEFRTPLTLMLGPLEDCLSDAAYVGDPQLRSRLQLVYDNTLRLLKLVNSLLDFSRLEAGRLRAHYAPLDVAKFTIELAVMFQSATAKAGLEYQVDCPRQTAMVWVDRDMWEKIVPNLISNAVKYTLQGHVAVRLREESEHVVLEVEDTGIGIPAQEVPRIFERFHRVAGAAGRTQEGTGIGLSLVHELVELHGGRVSVRSVVGQGSTFRVEIPKGFAHLPADLVAQQPVDSSLASDTATHVLETSRWVEETASHPQLPAQFASRARVLIVDDNADLRQYLSDLLSKDYEVTLARDGIEALERVRENTPDIVVSDVMMPRLDGVGLVRELRANVNSASLPVILLSARAGEEAAIEGLAAGSDDYVMKPFSARELLARVRTHVELSRMRRAWIAELERTNRELDAFSYSVSHDLKAPLRIIAGFTQALAEDYSKSLDDQARSYISYIADGVQRMTALIDALLELARISRAPLTKHAVNLTALAHTVVTDLQHGNPARVVTVEIAPDLHVRGDRHLLSVVLVNLIGNAWKFTSQTESPRIEVGRSPDAREPTFFVRDNGAGFDMARAKRLFSPFQRLHAAADFAGTGIGLATVQRVIGRHGGRIWAEAAVGKGATFFFTLPD